MDMLRLQQQPSINSSTPDDTMDKAKRIWSMLDELASSDPTSYKSFIEKTLKEGKEWMAPPTPDLAVRSTLHSNPKTKIFYLNIFTWLRLPAPIKTDELTKMYSLTPVETTYKNESCVIVNIAVHPDVMKIISTDQLIRSTFDLVVSQHNLLVDYERYTILKEKVVGNLEEIQQNFIKPILKNKTNNDNIDELIDNDLSPSLMKQLSSMTTNEQTSNKQQKKKNTKSSVLIEELWSIPAFTEEISPNNNFLIIRVSLPDCQSVADCDVTVLPREDTVQVECSKLYMRLKLDMKKRKKPTIPNCDAIFDIQRLTAKFVRKTQQLVLTIPIVAEPTVTEENK